ncbi:4-formylbenzenesulfonate dehydrogenase TsaC1/TsaC2 [Roseovarius litorisediminis]|uniref:4-formylbenzenesulfonate dehydrogenase TsaC1/TsaC2 n=1 Tax=Roseovarius litorisediminis TaxID=1312363 RepID=A0A1Y5RRC6_9RHOB|nr:SDR family oxidoreductase [Roseovarius litorisediminis]SLN23643.1 4-formylbenzenesulfonate dehydrogenase TsaC1/TsaC2 [Roseovarius litorisediminis]
MRFNNKNALVTGASGGIGKVLVAMLRAEGARVAVTDRDTSGVQAEAHLDGDLLDDAFCDGLPGQAAEALGGLDIVCNNAGVITRGNITLATDADYALTMGVNVEAPFRICRAAIPLMAQAGGGAIVNTASCWGLSPGPDHPLYIMSKAALASLTQCLARDHAHQGIRVNAVCPNEVNTPMLRTGFAIRGLDPDKAVDELNASVPLGRIAEPEDIADVIIFLASDAARYVCGALVEANGAKPVA